jgi:drug/metabolite transporter (DMT)-like permease
VRPAQVVQLLALSVVWGCAYLFMRASVPAFGPAPMIFLRMALGSALVLLPLVLWRFGPGPLRVHWRELLVFGIAFTAVPFLGLGYAAQSISAGMLAILQSAAPLFASVVARVWLREPISGGRAAGLAIGLAGVVLLVWDKVGVRDDAGVAILVALGVTVLWGVSSNYARVRLHAIEPLVLACGSLGLAAIALAPLAWLTWPAHAPGPRAWAEVLFLGLASTGAGFLMYFGLLRGIGAVRATSVTFLNPLVAMAAAAVYLGEAVTGRMVLGCAVILVGTALTLGLVPIQRRRDVDLPG